MADSVDSFELSPSDFGIRVASDEALARRDELADRICAELKRAGLPARRHSVDDEQALRNAAMALPGRANDPSLIHSGAVKRHMQAAIIAILCSVHAGTVSQLMRTVTISIPCSAGGGDKLGRWWLCRS
jgi:hypothetical protein